MSLLVAYLVAVGALQLVRALTGQPHPAVLAVSPAQLARGEVWRLATSALPVSRFAFLEIAGAVTAIALAVRAFGLGVFAIAAVLGHVGSTLVAYAGVGVMWLADPHWIGGLVEDADYGISAVWFAALGLLAVALGARRRALGVALFGGCVAVSFALLELSDWLAFAEHVLSLCFGAATGVVAMRRRAAR